MGWVVGKTMVGMGKPSAEVPATTERQAQYKLNQLLIQQVLAYEAVMAKSDPHGWIVALLRLKRLAAKMESGHWPPGEDGLNWLWSLPWGPEPTADRDLWVFWARFEGSSGGSGDGADVVPLVPKGGLKRELVA